MKVFRKAGIGIKLTGAFAAVLTLLAIVIGFAVLQIERLETSNTMLVNEGMRKATLARAAQNSAQAEAARLHSLFLLDAQANRIPVYADIDRRNAELNDALGMLDKAASDDEEREVLRHVVESRQRFANDLNETVDTVELDISQAKRLMLRQTTPALEIFLNSMEDLVALQARRAQSQAEDARENGTRSKRLMVLLGLAAVLAGALSAWTITRSVSRPLAEAVGFADAIAAGQLNGTLPEATGDEIGTLIAALERMRTGIADRETRILTLAYRDSLTGLPNRTLFNDRLRQAISAATRTGHPASVLVMDLDRFKHVNDILGHRAGDELIKDVASRLEHAMHRDSDTIARLGGDEFAILLPTQDSREAMHVAQSLLKTLELPITLDGQPVDVGASIGLASCPEHGDDADQLLSRADVAMYIAKRANSGVAVFDESFDRNREDSLSLMGELRRAVEQNQLVLNFQPKVALSTGMGRHVEALVRWQNPERGIVPPDQFIPFAERTGYIKAITRWVIERAIVEAAHWRRTGLDVGVSINISAQDLARQDLPKILSGLLDGHSVPPESICLEITESAIMDDPKAALATLDRLHAMRFRLSIDDFGTGYSSLSYLKRLPVQELKIDKSFVMNMANDADDAAIVRSTIDLAHNMGLMVVAEGIENQQIWDLLESWGCDYGQGYFVSRPLTSTKLEEWYARESERV